MSLIYYILTLFLTLILLRILFIWYSNYKQKSTVKNSSSITLEQADTKIKVIDKITESKLLGLNIKDSLLIWTNIVLGIFTILTYTSLKIQDEKLHRPYIGLANNVGVVLDYATSTDNEVISSAMRLKLKIKNYGELPTSFTSQVDGWSYGKISTFQNSKDFIMPGQEVDLLWNLNHGKDIFREDCNFLNNLSVKINYPGHYVTVIPKFIDDPRISKSDSNQKIYDFTVYGCKENKPQVLVWYIKEMK